MRYHRTASEATHTASGAGFFVRAMGYVLAGEGLAAETAASAWHAIRPAAAKSADAGWRESR